MMSGQTASGDYNKWHEEVHGSESLDVLRLAQWHHSAMVIAPEVTNRKVLEVGCGAGDFSITLSQKGAQVWGVDFSARAIEIAQAKSRVHKSNAQFRVADAQNLPFEDGTYDVVFSCECLEHVPDPQKMITEIHRVLKPGGTFVLTTENYSNAMALLWLKCWLTGKPFNSGAGVQPIEHFFVFWKVRKMLAQAGFKLEEQTGNHHVFFILPKMHPHTFVKEEFQSKMLSRLFRSIARHMAFKSIK
jgi:ubiquinone biosynthesis O-methyltransferase